MFSERRMTIEIPRAGTAASLYLLSATNDNSAMVRPTSEVAAGASQDFTPSVARPPQQLLADDAKHTRGYGHARRGHHAGFHVRVQQQLGTCPLPGTRARTVRETGCVHIVVLVTYCSISNTAPILAVHLDLISRKK